MKREALVLALMAELAAGEASRWAPYLVRAVDATRDLTQPADADTFSAALRRRCLLRARCTCR